MSIRIIYIALIFFIVFAPVIQGGQQKKKKINRLQKFESELWILDKNGCAGNRLDMKNQLLSLKHNMRGLKTSEIEDLLGMPDAQELYDRSQQYYIYFLEPGPKCDNAKEKPQALFVRFSAVGIANEFTIKPL
jgi:hypothetical protein